MILFKSPSGSRWHLYRFNREKDTNAACGLDLFPVQRVETDDVWIKPVSGHTCVKCQPFIKEILGK